MLIKPRVTRFFLRELRSVKKSSLEVALELWSSVFEARIKSSLRMSPKIFIPFIDRGVHLKRETHKCAPLLAANFFNDFLFFLPLLFHPPKWAPHPFSVWNVTFQPESLILRDFWIDSTLSSFSKLTSTRTSRRGREFKKRMDWTKFKVRLTPKRFFQI